MREKREKERKRERERFHFKKKKKKKKIDVKIPHHVVKKWVWGFGCEYSIFHLWIRVLNLG